MQREFCNSLILLPNTTERCEDKLSKSVKQHLSLLGKGGVEKKSQLVLLELPDTRLGQALWRK